MTCLTTVDHSPTLNANSDHDSNQEKSHENFTEEPVLNDTTQPSQNTILRGKKINESCLWTKHNKKTLRKQGFNFKENFSSQTCPLFGVPPPTSLPCIMLKWTQNETNEPLQDGLQLPYLGKPVEKGLRQAFSSSSLVQWILAGKQSGLTLLNSESHSQFGDINLAQIRNSEMIFIREKIQRTNLFAILANEDAVIT